MKQNKSTWAIPTNINKSYNTRSKSFRLTKVLTYCLMKLEKLLHDTQNYHYKQKLRVAVSNRFHLPQIDKLSPSCVKQMI